MFFTARMGGGVGTSIRETLVCREGGMGTGPIPRRIPRSISAAYGRSLTGPRRNMVLGRVFRCRGFDQLADEGRVGRRNPVRRHDLELLAVPLHHLEFSSAFVVGAGQFERWHHALDTDLLEAL